MNKSELQEKINEIDGCTDGNCMLVKRKGQHTNGGCNCHTNESKMRQILYYLRVHLNS